MRVSYLLSLSILLLGASFGSLYAQSIPQLDQKSTPVGTIGVYERADGSRFATKVSKISSGEYTYMTREGEDGEGSFISASVHDADGNRKSWEGPDAKWIYTPHACYRTLGECSYKVQNSEGGKIYRNTIDTSFDSVRVSWKRYYNGGLVSSGWYEIDPENSWILEFENSRGNTKSARLIGFKTP